MDTRLLSSLLPPMHRQGWGCFGIFFGRAGGGKRGEAGAMMEKAKAEEAYGKGDHGEDRCNNDEPQGRLGKRGGSCREVGSPHSLCERVG